ncbi:LOW QUALITY PROTEIN: hypothetical protein PanWU01x14_092510, partial [Parasponia andersonii]
LHKVIRFQVKRKNHIYTPIAAPEIFFFLLLIFFFFFFFFLYTFRTFFLALSLNLNLAELLSTRLIFSSFLVGLKTSVIEGSKTSLEQQRSTPMFIASSQSSLPISKSPPLQSFGISTS